MNTLTDDFLKVFERSPRSRKSYKVSIVAISLPDDRIVDSSGQEQNETRSRVQTTVVAIMMAADASDSCCDPSESTGST